MNNSALSQKLSAVLCLVSHTVNEVMTWTVSTFPRTAGWIKFMHWGATVSSSLLKWHQCGNTMNCKVFQRLFETCIKHSKKCLSSVTTVSLWGTNPEEAGLPWGSVGISPSRKLPLFLSGTERAHLSPLVYALMWDWPQSLLRWAHTWRGQCLYLKPVIPGGGLSESDHVIPL